VETPHRRRARHALRSRANWVQLVKFCFVGAIGYVINLAVYTTLLYWVHYLVAATCSFLVAATSNYFLNRRWTFHDRHRHIGVQGVQFLLVSAVALGANLFVLHLLIRAGAHEKGAQALAIIVATPLNFLGNRLWSFRTIR
jgi:dolichol-phosphate mannosyltransferase